MREKVALIGNAALLLTACVVVAHFGCSGEEAKGNGRWLSHFRNSIELTNEAGSLFDPPSDSGVTYSVDRATQLRALSLFRQALAESEQITDEELRRLHDALPTMYGQDFRGGLTLMIEGIDQGDIRMLREGQLRAAQFGSWYKSNLEGK